MSDNNSIRPNDSEHDLACAVSLVAAMEGATDLDGHSALLPYLGMARAELTDFGQRRVTNYLAVGITDLHAATVELEWLLTAMLSKATVEQHRLRIEAALRYLDAACLRLMNYPADRSCCLAQPTTVAGIQRRCLPTLIAGGP